MTDEVSKDDFDETVKAVSDVVSRFCPGLSLQTVEWTHHPLDPLQTSTICEVRLRRGVPVSYRGDAPRSAGLGTARRRTLEDMSSTGGWPRAFSGDEMRLRLSLLPENELRRLSRLCAAPGLSMPRTAPAV